MKLIVTAVRRLFSRKEPAYKYFAKHASERMHIKTWDL